jgi:adenylate cyclase
MAEVELPSTDTHVEIPGWIGEEVTGDARYYNANLVARPFTRWGQTA